MNILYEIIIGNKMFHLYFDIELIFLLSKPLISFLRETSSNNKVFYKIEDLRTW